MFKYNAHNSIAPIYTAWQIEPNERSYNLNFSYQLDNIGQAKLVIEKLQELISLKAHLRQTFNYENDILTAYVHDELPAKIFWFKAKSENYAKTEHKILHQFHDLNNESSIKLNIVHITDTEKYIVFFNIHHILLDGISTNNLLEDLNKLINSKVVKGETSEDIIKYIKDIPALNEVTNKEKKLNKYIETVNKYSDLTINHVKYNKNETLHYFGRIPKETSIKLFSLSQSLNISIFNLLLLAYAIYIAKLTNEDFSLINYATNLRDSHRYGSFVNTLTMPLKITHRDSYLSIIERWKKLLPFFKTMSNYSIRKNLTLNQVIHCSQLCFELFSKLRFGRKSYTIKAYPQLADGIMSLRYQINKAEIFVSYSILKDVYPDYLSTTLLNRFFHFMDKLLNNSHAKVNKLDLLFDEERHKLLYEFNDTYRPFPEDKTVYQLFEEQVEKTPDNIALVYENEKLTYQELNNKANQLAHYIRGEYNIKVGDCILMFMNKNPGLIISMLGILKLGGAYIVIDTSHPGNRIIQTIKDTSIKLILSNSNLSKKIKNILKAELNNKVPIEFTDMILAANKKSSLPKTNLNIKIKPSAKANIIYTSGTTGSPKGIIINHTGIISLVKNVNYISIEEHDTILQLSNIAFDASTFEIWGTLLNGAKLVITYDSYKILDNKSLKKILLKHKITIMWLTTTAFDNLYLMDKTVFKNLKYLIVGGEALSYKLIKQLISSEYSPKHLLNGYGPTENSTFSCTHEITKANISKMESIWIGKPLSNRKVYILDKNLQMIPIGLPGEIYLSGVGLSDGYINNVNLTKEKFIKNHLCKDKNSSKLYKSGDIAKLVNYPDLNVEFIGRLDSQTKIRGYRIDLSEIENNLNSHPKVEASAIIIKKSFINEQMNKYIIGYYVSLKKLDENMLKRYLLKRLPSYMIPANLYHLRKIPQTQNGKIDTQALLEIKKSSKTPNSQIAEKLDGQISEKLDLICKAFCKVLNIDHVNINDNFFFLGGNSILAVSLVTFLQQNFEVSLNDIFIFKTPKNLSEKIIYSKNNLYNKLQTIKNFYNSPFFNNDNYLIKDIKYKEYIKHNSNLPIAYETKNISNVLLTGATGYLGCHLLHQLLNTTNYKVTLLLRGSSHNDALTKLQNKYQYYFGFSINEFMNRIEIYNTNLSEKNLGLTHNTYLYLAENIDSIIHTAALVKHYGDYKDFYLTNVQSTINLLEFTKLTKQKDFHYISTIGVFMDGAIAESKQHIFTEDDDSSALKNKSNYYCQTKSKAELITKQYLKQGINANIYRIGNILINSNTHKYQENIEDNGSFKKIKTILKLGSIAKGLEIMEISPVNMTADAIIKIFNQANLRNQVYHVFNPYQVNLYKLFNSFENINVKIATINNFLDSLFYELKKNKDNSLIEIFILHQFGMQYKGLENYNKTHIVQNRTQAILSKLGFNWTQLDYYILKNIINKCLQGF